MDRTQVNTRGFTLIELVISIAISSIIAGALYFCLKTALDSWQTAQDELLLQSVSCRIEEELVEGLPDAYGLRDVLEVVDASPQSISVVMPWTDDSNEVYTGIAGYTLNKHIKSGTAVPVAEASLPESEEFKVVPAALRETGKSEDYPMMYLKSAAPAGSRLRFTFHPDCAKDGDVLTVFRYDAAEKAVLAEDINGRRNISQNTFGVEVVDFVYRYFNNSNTELGKDGSLSSGDIPSVTGIEIAFKTRSKKNTTRETLTFVSLRNAPGHSGYLSLSEGGRFIIPDSKNIKALFLTNLSGIKRGDVLVLDAKPESGKDWRLTVHFSRMGTEGAPLVDYYSVEYPSGNQVYVDRPRTDAEIGLNLLTLSPNGRYDYKDDDMGDMVVLKGKVTLEVEKMDIGGAALFVKP
ncbi:MAG: prepilin-type N-terminal cleavage/methylation domain-containing protein [Candidatus Omnitrophica bacterium]|nr:prepilin-type N-terminal cleavage/methylation domain-containing protein [Candidatus Omnitrophota bacterium]